MRRALVAALFVLMLPLAAQAQQLSSTNYTSAQANATISAAYSYVNAINESGYLIFQPNLTASYKYLSTASQVYNGSPDSAVFDARKAQQLAQQQYGDMSYYKGASLIAMAAISIILAMCLLKIMQPLRPARKGR